MSTAFVSVPLFQGINQDGLQGLGEVFETLEVPAGEVLFASGEIADRLYLLIDGQVALHEDGEKTIDLNAISLIGELGAMVGLNRRLTAVTLAPSMFLVATGASLRTFFERNASVAVTFYQNLLGMSADKIRRDERRIDDMRRNLVKTQKGLKAMRDLVLDSPATEVSEPIHDMLEHLISQNRRANYVVEPPSALPVTVRRPDGSTFPVLQMSRQFLLLPGGAAPGDTDEWKGVLTLPNTELPLTGGVEDAGPDLVRVDLDLLIDEYSVCLEDYLTQAQLLDILL